MKTGVSRSLCGAIAILLGQAALPPSLPAQEMSVRRGLSFRKNTAEAAPGTTGTEKTSNRFRLRLFAPRRPPPQPLVPPPPPPEPAPRKSEIVKVLYTSTEGRVRPRETQPSVSFLPDGSVITQDTTITASITPESQTLPPAEMEAPDLAVTTLYPPAPAPAPPTPDPTLVVKPKPVINAQWATLISPGLVKSPYPPHALLDVQGFRSGSLAEDPASKKIFRVP